jgi:organic radical activating enzyme
LEKDKIHQLEEGKALPVMEEFYSIQGEGKHTGKAAYFIRIGGCDVGCLWCDVKESWDASIHPLINVDDLVNRVEQCPAKGVVLTGGEPLMYNVVYLCSLLKERKIKIYLETSGAYPLNGEFDWICLSPKRNSHTDISVINKANELKVIIEKKNDLELAEEYADKMPSGCLLYLQPEWSRSKEILPVIVDYILGHPKWQISIQSHKYMKIP